MKKTMIKKQRNRLYAEEIDSCDSVFHGVESSNSFIGKRISEEIPAKIYFGERITPRVESE